MGLDGATSRMSPPATTAARILQNLESIEILTLDVILTHQILFTINVDDHWTHPYLYRTEGFPFGHLAFPNLKVLRCRAAIEPNLLKCALKQAADNGTLEVLEVSIESGTNPARMEPGDPRLWHPNPNGHPIPVRDFSFFSENIHTLGLHDFNWAPPDNFYSSFDGQPFIEWMERFPKLHTVHVYPGPFDHTAPFLMSLIRHPRIKTIHQDRLTGVDWDAARRLARKNGVELYHTPGVVPAKWPTWV